MIKIWPYEDAPEEYKKMNFMVEKPEYIIITPGGDREGYFEANIITPLSRGYYTWNKLPNGDSIYITAHRSIDRMPI